MKEIIWYWEDVEKAKSILKDTIIKQYASMGIEAPMQRGRYIESKHGMSVCFENGDIWDVVPANDSCRGRACNVGYISDRIPDEMRDCVVMPCLKSYPYQAWRTWYE